MARLAFITLCVAVAITAVLDVALLAARHQLDSSIGRIDGAFEGLHDRPPEVTSGPGAGALDILVLGTDRRSPAPTTGSAAKAPSWVPGAQRTDTMMLVHVTADRSSATAVSLPRDSWVDIPGRGHHKLNAAFSYGGPSLAVAAVEQLTGIRIDHLAIVDHQGLQSLVDVLGGVDVTVPRTVRDSANDTVWARGSHHLDGTEALLFVRQRYGLPGGDFDRIDRQHQVVRSLLGSLRETARSLDVLRLHRLLTTATTHVSVDSGWESEDLMRLLLDVRHLDQGGVDFMTAPVLGTGWEGEQSVVRLDDAAGRALWAALRRDQVPTD